MPVPILKFAIIFEGTSGYGFSEIHYKAASGENPNLQTQLDTFAANILPARQALLGFDSAIVGARVSYPRAGAIAALPMRRYYPGNPDQPSCSPALSIALLGSNNLGTAKKIIHLRAFWDAVEKNAGYDPSGAAGWTDRMNAYKAALISGSYGWLSKDPALSANGKVTNYVSDAANIVTFTVAATTGALPAVGTIISVAFSKLNHASSVLNRTLLVQVVNATTLKTVNPIAAGAFVSEGRFNYRGTTFQAFATFPSAELGQRRQGKPLNRLAGRARARKTV